MDNYLFLVLLIILIIAIYLIINQNRKIFKESFINRPIIEHNTSPETTPANSETTPANSENANEKENDKVAVKQTTKTFLEDVDLDALIQLFELFNPNGEFSIDNLNVNGKLKVNELEVKENSQINGNVEFGKVGEKNSFINFNTGVRFNENIVANKNVSLKAEGVKFRHNNQVVSEFNSNGELISDVINTNEILFNLNKEDEKNNKKSKIKVDSKGFQVYTNDKLEEYPIMSLPHNTNKAPIFRATGLAYSNSAIDHSDSGDSKFTENSSYGNYAYETLTKDPMYYKNMIYLGGMSYENNSKWMMIAGNRYKNGKYVPAVLGIHGGGDDRNICGVNKKIGSCNVSEAAIKRNFTHLNKSNFFDN